MKKFNQIDRYRWHSIAEFFGEKLTSEPRQCHGLSPRMIDACVTYLEYIVHYINTLRYGLALCFQRILFAVRTLNRSFLSHPRCLRIGYNQICVRLHFLALSDESADGHKQTQNTRVKSTAAKKFLERKYCDQVSQYAVIAHWSVYMRQTPKPQFLQIMACRLFGTKPLSEAMLKYC